jgi:DsbC/DsbD-like thiol-disulfide interchange protein
LLALGKPRTMRYLLILSLWASSFFSFAGNPVKWSFSSEVAADGSVQVLLTAMCEEGWHLYALELPRDDGPLATIVTADPSGAYAQTGPVVEPKPVEVEDPNFLMLVRYHEGTCTFRLPIRRLIPEAFMVTGRVEYMCCNDKMCLPPVKVEFSVPLAKVN